MIVLLLYCYSYSEQDKLLSTRGEEKSVEVFGHFALASSDVLLRCAFSYESNIQLDGLKSDSLLNFFECF